MNNNRVELGSKVTDLMEIFDKLRSIEADGQFDEKEATLNDLICDMIYRRLKRLEMTINEKDGNRARLLDNPA